MKNICLSEPLSPEPQVDTFAFDAQLSNLKSDFITMWQSASEECPQFGREYSEEDQLATEARVQEVIIDEKDADLGSDESMVQMQRVKSAVRGLVVRSADAEYRDDADEILGEFSEAGDVFVRQARTFDPDLEAEDVFQALRNFWIFNSMQVGFGLPVRVTPSGFAYSLLYPYSDNLLDSPAISSSDKREFNRRFRLRLSGFTIPPASRLESKISDLLEMIETEFPRSMFPDVYESLLAIHSGQEKSLRQHAGVQREPQSDLLDISVEKGGTSVLADAYLAKGALSVQESEFGFGYGVFLQFIDDLQDVGEDLRNGHQTLFTVGASRGSLDMMANRLQWFIEKVLTAFNPSSHHRSCALTQLVRRSCHVLVTESIAQCPGLYTDDYSRIVERRSPMTFAHIRGLHEKIEAKQSSLRKLLKNKRFLAATTGYA